MVDAALIGRFREINPQVLASEIEFDRAADVSWVWLRKLLEGWRDVLSHPGLNALPPALQATVDLPALRVRAKQARSLHERLFGADGTAWVMSSFIEQSQTMATILGMIEADGLRKDLEAVVGPALPLLLTTMQVHYEDMVAERMSRENRPGDDFRELRTQLRWRIDHYKGAVESLADPDEPESYDIVNRALRSLVLINQRMSAGGTSEEIDESLDGDFVELDLSDPDEPDEPPQLSEEAPAPVEA
ncbi:hypothetical protein DB30_06356 [Enhygromyxa salina]|uniref:Uncharacterized protein n=1 Tax=Enhygromyxa salina TaxID=215803 RepID=A0A0C2CYS2_9BACT|nr:hypothetical protein DB30_06356 [Enhygromyxa salina]